jgi:O-antigen ligase
LFIKPLTTYYSKLIVVFWCFFSFGLTLSKPLISIGFIGFSVLGLWLLFTKPKQKFWNIYSAILVISFLLSLLSIINTQNLDEGFRKLVLKLPLFCFPFVLLSLSTCDAQLKKYLVIIFTYAMYLPGLISVYNYYINKRLFDDLILQSKPLPIEFGYGIYHIQFSVLLAASIIIGLYYIIHLFHSKKIDIYFYLLLFLVGSNFVFIHVLTARTGILAMYLALIVLILISLPKLKLKTKVLISLSTILLPIIMIVSSSALKNRLKNSFEDIHVVMQGKDVNDYSFAMRVEAWRNAWDLSKKYRLIGVGIGDVELELNQNFANFNPSVLPKNRRSPHLQFLETMVESGLINAFLLFLFFLLLFIRGFQQKGFILALLLGVVFFVSSCFESILERQATMVGFAMLMAFGLSFIKNENKKLDLFEV